MARIWINEFKKGFENCCWKALYIDTFELFRLKELNDWKWLMLSIDKFKLLYNDYLDDIYPFEFIL